MTRRSILRFLGLAPLAALPLPAFVPAAPKRLLLIADEFNELPSIPAAAMSINDFLVAESVRINKDIYARLSRTHSSTVEQMAPNPSGSGFESRCALHSPPTRETPTK